MAARALCSIVLAALLGVPTFTANHGGDGKLDSALLNLAHAPRGTSRVLVAAADGRPADALIRQVGGRPGRYLASSQRQVALIADAALHRLAALDGIAGISLDRAVRGTMDRTAATIGARWVNQNLQVDGSGVGVATIDSGISAWHDDLDSDRVAQFVDFVNEQPTPYDDYGHGTHVAGIIAGSGHDSGGARRGVAPGARLVVLKALDAEGGGYISNVIAAIDYAIANRDTFNIKVINLSVAAGVYESYLKDPLTLAARRAVDAGIVVVAAAGNLGRGPGGKPQYGAIAAPGNAPWVLTVGASSHVGTPERSDDVVAVFSSRGPASLDRAAKPDLVAPGVGITSTTEPASALFASHPGSRLRGTVRTVSEPYLSLSGTSMAAPVVTGTIALMLQANPALTPNAVKAILQYTSEWRAPFDHFTQGAGFLNARGAVQLARAFAGRTEAASPDPVRWTRHIIWGDWRASGGQLTSSANAWRRGVVWGAATTPAGQRVAWGTRCEGTGCTGPVWSVPCDTPGCRGRSGGGVESLHDIAALRGRPVCDESGCTGDPVALFEAEGADDPLRLVLAGSVSCAAAAWTGASFGWSPSGEPLCPGRVR